MKLTAKAFWQEIKGLDMKPDSRILLAFSGGEDSTVLFHLLVQAKLSFSAAHVNYGLRGLASEEDERFCSACCAQYGIPFYVYQAKEEMKASESVQVTARTIRYRFFEELVLKEGFDFVLTAHHGNDSVETFFLNALRGSGAQGLGGIPAKNGKIRRPLLAFPKKEIQRYAQTHKLSFRVDQSNLKKDYARNALRIDVVSALEALEPLAVERLQQSMHFLKQEAELLNTLLAQKWEPSLAYTAKEIVLAFPENLRATVLFKRFQPIGLNYSQAQDLALALDGIPGKLIYTETHRILLDRHAIVSEEKKSPEKDEALPVTLEKLQIPGYSVRLEPIDHVQILKDASCAFLDFETLRFPLVWRKVNLGDAMVPLGMRGKKKISDIWIDTKKSRFEKEQFHVLCHGNEIYWLEGFRISDSSKITEKTSQVLCILPEKM